MALVITGMCRRTSAAGEEGIDNLHDRIKPVRLTHVLERLVVAGVGDVLDDARIPFPVGHSDIGIYIGIDRAVEDIKDEYFVNILNEGMLGASPLLFPYTSPNAFAAQASIAFDLRGESVTMPINFSFRDVINYAACCVAGKYSKTAVAGGIAINDKALSVNDGRYTAEFLFIEEARNAVERGVKIYHHIKDGMHEDYRFD